MAGASREDRVIRSDRIVALSFQIVPLVLAATCG
jgi:hypothetical protein